MFGCGDETQTTCIWFPHELNAGERRRSTDGFGAPPDNGEEMMASVATFAVVFAGLGGLVVLLAVYNGIILHMLWGWFLVPLGVPQIGVAWAIGISALAGLLTPTIPPPESSDDGWTHMGNILLKPLLALVIGFVAKSFM